MKTIHASTTIQLTVTLNGSNYGPEWDIDKIFEQASREAEEEIRRMFSVARVSGFHVEQVIVKAIIVEKKL